MKRITDIHNTICSIDNLRLADKKARRGKSKQPGVIRFDLQPETNLLLLNESLLNKTYMTSPYTTFKVFEPKEREVYRLPYFPDRITHHAIMNLLEPMFTSVFTADTYSCIKGRGIHGASYNLRKALKDVPGTQYCLKLDIKKFYPNIDHDVLKSLLRRKIKDQSLLWLIDSIIDSADGLPIGNYLSQYFANFYLTYFDHWIKEVKGVKYYFRYCDDLVFLASNKPDLHKLLFEVRQYLTERLKLTIKENYQVFPVSARGIDFVGYVHYHDRVMMRKGIKKSLVRAVSCNKRKSMAAYFGWAKHSNSKNLLEKLGMKNFSDLGITRQKKAFTGEKIKIKKILNKEVIVHDYDIQRSNFEDKGNGKRLCLQLEVDGDMCIAFTGSTVLQDMISQVNKPDGLPFKTTIIPVGEAFEFK